MLIAGRAADAAQQLIRREAEEARSGEAQILGPDNLARGPDQHVGVPDRRHAMLGHAEHLHLDVIGTVEDRLGARRFRQREEWPLHQIALVARAGVAADHHEGIEPGPLALARRAPPFLLDTERHSARSRVRPRSIGGPGKRAVPSGPLSTCARRSRTMLADPRPHRRHDRRSCDRPARCHRFDASPGYGWRFRESARRRACAEVVAADLPSGRASTSPSVCGSRAVGGDSASWLTVAEKRRLGACRICAHALTAPRNPSVELCQPGSNGLAGC